MDLYADGGVIGRNPSTLGGTWAWQITWDDVALQFDSGFVTPDGICLAVVTNNFTELFAVVTGMHMLPDRWDGKIFTDSMITKCRLRQTGKKAPSMKGI